MNYLTKLYADNPKLIGNKLSVVKNESEASLYIYDVIDDYYGISAESVIEAVAKAQGAKTLNIYINSPGGSVFEARAIMAAINRFDGKTVAYIDSLCASAATSIALACNEVVMLEGALFMIHNASGIAWGDKATMRSTADLLEKIELSIIKDYTDKTGKPDVEIITMMDAESWLTASESLEHGFIDRIQTSKTNAKNTWNLSAYANAPEAFKQPPDPETPLNDEPAPTAGFFTSATNQNRLTLLQIQ